MHIGEVGIQPVELGGVVTFDCCGVVGEVIAVRYLRGTG